MIVSQCLHLQYQYSKTTPRLFECIFKLLIKYPIYHNDNFDCEYSIFCNILCNTIQNETAQFEKLLHHHNNCNKSNNGYNNNKHNNSKNARYHKSWNGKLQSKFDDKSTNNSYDNYNYNYNYNYSHDCFNDYRMFLHNCVPKLSIPQFLLGRMMNTFFNTINNFFKKTNNLLFICNGKCIPNDYYDHFRSFVNDIKTLMLAIRVRNVNITDSKKNINSNNGSKANWNGKNKGSYTGNYNRNTCSRVSKEFNRVTVLETILSSFESGSNHMQWQFDLSKFMLDFYFKYHDILASSVEKNNNNYTHNSRNTSNQVDDNSTINEILLRFIYNIGHSCHLKIKGNITHEIFDYLYSVLVLRININVNYIGDRVLDFILSKREMASIRGEKIYYPLSRGIYPNYGARNENRNNRRKWKKFPYLWPDPIFLKRLISKWIELEHVSMIGIFENNENFIGSVRLNTCLSNIMKMPSIPIWAESETFGDRVASKMFYYCLGSVLNDIIYDQLFDLIKQSLLIQRLTIPMEMIDIIVDYYQSIIGIIYSSDYESGNGKINVYDTFGSSMNYLAKVLVWNRIDIYDSIDFLIEASKGCNDSQLKAWYQYFQQHKKLKNMSNEQCQMVGQMCNQIGLEWTKQQSDDTKSKKNKPHSMEMVD